MKGALAGILTVLAAFAAAWGIPSDLALWYQSPLALAGVVAALVALIRKHVWRAEGAWGIALSVILAVALSYLGSLAGHLSGDWIGFGLLAGVMASGGVDLVRSLGGNRAPAQPAPGPGPDVDRSRLR
ncbi:hypothetical protein [Thermus tengchongensis]|uniref:Uncharacterized protein n=1 Tax=Thermus tengchongensis TaxID=1214928 RepID=A0A4Y9F9B7_9DEIN|nr:hypothetical protein [Thermus tengchongensis]TFU25442.1 hypothetical protein E0687_10985 [Thermus tengchongensis]